MPVRYDIPNVNDIADTCPYCAGKGVQFLGKQLGWRGCPYCTTGYRIRNCPHCHGHGCDQCTGTMHTFHSDLITQSRIQLPDTSARRFADGAQTRAPRIVNRRR